ncbi:winged helix-turn-helix domain-containing protein [Candidatus Methanomassiliicoccus intestinalis]|uniref:winged helix-turn-helix domain-containing protein n=1 Tax=Candidatus Methanomassiliicoccus intestinalis TaxID=1406512 RepID=UPI0037DD6F4D
MTDEILLEIRELRAEMNTLSEKLARLRYSDFKNLCTEYMRPIIADEGRKVFENDRLLTEQNSTCSARAACTLKLKELVELSTREFENGNVEKASAILNEAKELVCCNADSCQDQECSRKTLEVLQKINSVQNTYLRIIASMSTESLVPATPVVSTEEEVEDYLAPLSNAKRIAIMRSLVENPRTLSYLCKEFNMPTGHITFHLNALKDSGYVMKDTKTKLYSLTARGSVALNGIDLLIQQLKGVIS